MKKVKQLLCVFLCIAVLISNFTLVSFAQTENSQSKIKNIIYMIPDGAGMASFFLADYIKMDGGFDKTVFPNLTPVETGEMYIKQYLVGAETTHSASHKTTDSAAGGTALAGGYKANNGTIGIDPNYKPHATILEACQLKGMTTGIVATHAWPDATPAAFSSHAVSRKDFADIGTQQAYQDMDLIIACDAASYSKLDWFQDSLYQQRGYTVVKTREELQNIKAGDKVAGKIPNLYYEIDKPAETPTLAEITQAAIRAVDDGNENGFFLMIEGSAIDGGGHDASPVKLASEWLSFDAACKVAIEYAKGRDDTVVMILPDHDTGGLTITKGDHTRESLQAIVDDVKVGIDPAEKDLAWESWDTGDKEKRLSHTSRNGGVFMYLPDGVSYPEGIDISKKDDVLSTFEDDFTTCEVNRIDNTHVAPYLASLVGIDLDEATKKLFVDVTDYGVYDASTGIFTCTTSDGIVITAQKNKSLGTINGEPIDLNGEVCVYIRDDEKFYAPQSLFDSVNVGNPYLSVYADYNSKTVRVEGVAEACLSDIAIVVTQPNKTVDASINADGFATFPYINQIKSTPWREYALDIDLGEGEIGDYKYYTRINNGKDIITKTFSLKDMTVLKGNTKIEDIADLKKGDTITLKISGYDSSYDGIASIAQYDEDGNLLGATPQYIKGNATKYGDFSSFDATVLENADTIKAFYWEKNNLIPFTGAYVID